jgi:hypothetical protein
VKGRKKIEAIMSKETLPDTEVSVLEVQKKHPCCKLIKQLKVGIGDVVQKNDENEKYWWIGGI